MEKYGNVKGLQGGDKTGKDLEIIKRGLVVSCMVPVNEWRLISILLLAISPMRSYGPYPVDLRMRSSSEGSVTLSIDLSLERSNPIRPVPGVLDLNDKDSAKE